MNVVKDLERLSALKAGGHINEAEYHALKARLLADEGATTSLSLVSEPHDAVADDKDHTADESWIDDGEPRSRYGEASKKPWLLAAVLAVIAAIGVGFLFWPAAEARTATLTQTDLNCRAEPGLQGSVTEIIRKGATVSLDSSKDGWGRVSKTDCWLKENRLSFVTSQQSAAAPTAVPVPAAKPETADQSARSSETCEIAMIRSAAFACEVSTTATFYPNENIGLLNLQSQATSEDVQRKCPGSGRTLLALYGAGTSQLMKEARLGNHPMLGYVFPRCSGAVIAAISEVPGLMQQVQSFDRSR